MTLYFTNPMRMRRRMMENMFNAMTDNEWPSDERAVVFPVDVAAEDDGYTISAFLPGVKPEDVNIQIVNTTVTIQGDLKVERDEKVNYLLQERPSGRFYRTLNLPEPLDAGKTEASLENGVLTLHVPKAEEARPKTIKVVNK